MIKRMRLIIVFLSVSSVPPWCNPSPAQSEAAGRAKVLVAAPLGVPAGQPNKVTLRGLRFDGATEVRCHHPRVTVKLLGPPEKVTVQRDMANTLGDTTVEVEVAVPADAPPEVVTLAVITPAGEGLPHTLIVDEGPGAAEREPNNGFRDAQPVALSGTVAGAVQAPLDVDVFRFDGAAGQQVVCEVLAARLGSPLDAALTLYDANGGVLATGDDSADGRDPVLTVTLPRSGPYFLALFDADDRGGPSHVYRLLVRPGPDG
jgi:hypothetical protein